VRMGKGWMCFRDRCLGVVVRRGACGGIVNGISIGVVALLVDDSLH